MCKKQTDSASGITFVVAAYNEESRINSVLAHGVCWADQILLLNKSSTDRTEEIAGSYGSKVKILTIPYSPQGQDGDSSWADFSDHDWIFYGTCSEVPTKNLILEAKRLIAETGNDLDLIFIPRKMYSLGIHDQRSPWSVALFPFLFNRHRVIHTGIIHDHFRASHPSRVATIPYSDSCCVYHLTHVSAIKFIEVHAQYAKIEAEVERDPERAIVEWLENISSQVPRIFQTGENWQGIFAAYGIYNLMNILLTWEKARGLDVPAYYQELRAELLDKEWGVSLGSVVQDLKLQSPTRATFCFARSERIDQELRITVFLVFWAAKLLYYTRHPKEILRSLRGWAARQKARVLRKLRSNKC